MREEATESRVYVGQASLQGGIARYARTFDLLELSAEPGRHPARKTLRQWRAEVPEDFAFSVVVPSGVADLEGRAGSQALLEQTLDVAGTLRAAWCVIRTPPSVMPSARSLRRLGELVERLRAPGRSVAWDPRGLWTDEDLVDAARSLGVRVVRDLSREDPVPPGEAEVYTRLRALGAGMRVGAGAAERVAERLAGVERAFVVVEGAGAGRVRKALLGAMTLSGDGGDVWDEELEPGDDDDRDARGEEEE